MMLALKPSASCRWVSASTLCNATMQPYSAKRSTYMLMQHERKGTHTSRKGPGRCVSFALATRRGCNAALRTADGASALISTLVVCVAMSRSIVSCDAMRPQEDTASVTGTRTACNRARRLPLGVVPWSP
eukprot:scaffold631_cov378-Prasinococcus_capsulatus_cf.AAC.17